MVTMDEPVWVLGYMARTQMGKSQMVQFSLCTCLLDVSGIGNGVNYPFVRKMWEL